MDAIIHELWEDYNAVTPSMKEVKQILNLANNNSFCDHISFRTIADDTTGITKNITTEFGIEMLSKGFLETGYTLKNSYYFKEKKLRAIHLEKKNSPKIFISELILNNCSTFLKSRLLNVFKKHNTKSDTHLEGRTWNVDYKTYETLKNESEYAAWLYIHGHRVNHFTIDVNQLKGFSIENVCTQLKTYGIKLNSSGGGIIKGSYKQGLKQASTLADKIFVKFEDREVPIKIPSCYVEFVERFIINNKIFNGFITESTNRTLEPTNKVA